MKADFIEVRDTLIKRQSIVAVSKNGVIVSVYVTGNKIDFVAGIYPDSPEALYQEIKSKWLGENEQIDNRT